MIAATAIIAEDEPLLAQSLQADLARLWPGLRIVASVGDGQAAVEQALALQPQLLFLDIRMPGMSGLEAAQALAEDWPGDPASAPFPLIVFVTAYDQYALQAFDRAAVDYLLKPVQGDRLAQTCSRLQATLRQRTPVAALPALQEAVEKLRSLLPAPDFTAPGTPPPERLRIIAAAVGATVQMVPVDTVLYFEAADKYVRVISAEREYLIRTSLRELLPRLDPQRFWQIHRGTVVRCDAIASALRDETTGKLTLALTKHPDRLSVSRLYAHRFKAM